MYIAKLINNFQVQYKKPIKRRRRRRRKKKEKEERERKKKREKEERRNCLKTRFFCLLCLKKT